MRTLVTGGAGFIGSHLVERLLALGHAVVVVDDFDDYYAPALKRRNAEQLAAKGAVVLEGDIRDVGFLREALKGPFDAFLHLAARAGVRPSIKDPGLYTDVNVTGTVNLLERARDLGVSRFVFASSSSVYGERATAPFHEDDSTSEPISPYGATKKAGEALCHVYHHLFGMHVTCLRFFTAYGPRQRPDMALHRFASAIAARRELEIYGDGSARRDFTYVADIVSGVVVALERAKGYRVYNLGESKAITVSSMVDAVGKALGIEPRIRYLPPQPGDVGLTCADVSRARAELGYEPKVPFDEGVREFARWFRSEMGER